MLSKKAQLLNFAVLVLWNHVCEKAVKEKARNPKTGEILSVEPHYVAAFRAGQELKKALMEIPVEKK